MGMINLFIFIFFCVIGFGESADKTIIYCSLTSILIAFLLEIYLSHKYFRPLKLAELFGAGIFGSIVSSFIITAILLVCGVII